MYLKWATLDITHKNFLRVLLIYIMSREVLDAMRAIAVMPHLGLLTLHSHRQRPLAIRIMKFNF